MKKKEIPKPRLTFNYYSTEKKKNRNINIFNYELKLTDDDNYFNFHKKNIMSNEPNIINENKIINTNLKSKKIQKKQRERKNIGLGNINNSNLFHNMTCCNLESYLGAFKNNISQIQNIPSLTGGDNSEGKIIDDILKRNSETAETKQKNFINSSKEFLSRAQNSFDSLINHENSDKIELVNENIPILYSRIEQINEVLEKQNKEIMKIFKKDDNNKNSEDIINLKILNKYLQETINKNNEKINYLQRENQKYKSKYFEMKKKI